jgi:DNA-binding transcriptional ArsR family regulator
VAVDETLRALAHPTRRAMLELVWDAERSSSAIADAVGATRPATSQHLKVLRDAGLVQVRVDGNQRLYRVDTGRLTEVRAALERFWGARLGRLSEAVATDPDREALGALALPHAGPVRTPRRRPGRDGRLGAGRG